GPGGGGPGADGGGFGNRLAARGREKCRTASGAAAVAACGKAVKADFRDFKSYRRLGDALVSVGRYRRAIRAYRKALHYRPNFVKAAEALEHAQELLRRNGAPAETRTASNDRAGGTEPTDTVTAQLALLKRLQEQGLISEAQYQARQQALLDGTFGSREAEAPATQTAALQAKPAVVIPAGIEFGRYHALVIGNDTYEFLPDLKTAAADARAAAAVLRDRYGFEVTLLENATRYQIITALDKLRAKLTEDDNLMIYYAGHGIVDFTTERGYWLPVDAEENSSANWIANTAITDAIKAMPAKHVMVVADSCYSGTLMRSAPAQLPTGTERNAYLARMAAKQSRTILASGGVEPVADSGGGGHSVFAQAFLTALRENDGVLDGQALFDRIKRPVITNSDQTPEYSDIRLAGHDGGDFLLVPR
ncbi:MAG: caspase family protein, partial [Kiloniellales bacterium]